MTLRGISPAAAIPSLAGTASGASGVREFLQWLSAGDDVDGGDSLLSPHLEEAAARWLREHGQRPGEEGDAAAPRASICVRVDVLRRGDAIAALSRTPGMRSLSGAALAAAQYLSTTAATATAGRLGPAPALLVAAASRDIKSCAVPVPSALQSSNAIVGVGLGRATARFSAGAASAKRARDDICVSTASAAVRSRLNDQGGAGAGAGAWAGAGEEAGAGAGAGAGGVSGAGLAISHATLTLLSGAVAEGARRAVAALVAVAVREQKEATVNCSLSTTNLPPPSHSPPPPVFHTLRPLMGRASSAATPAPLPTLDLFSMRAPDSSSACSWISARPFKTGGGPPPRAHSIACSRAALATSLSRRPRRARGCSTF